MTVEVHDGVLYGADRIVAAMVEMDLPHLPAGGFGSEPRALGVVRNGVLVGGVVYHDARGEHDIEGSASMRDPRWARPKVMRRLFEYPFVQLGLRRMTMVTAASNARARRAIEHMGFRQEGEHPLGWGGLETAISYGLLRDDCSWLRA